jgi:NADPH-dependent glutamate synthase beta subunit-like oxidoreductase/NAD(P)H-flavin reductase
MTTSKSSFRPSPSHPQLDFSAWVEATSAPEELVLGIPGFAYADLFEAARLADLTSSFHEFVKQTDESDHADLLALAAGEARTPEETSDILVRNSRHLSAFVARLFGVEHEVAGKIDALRADDPAFVFKRDFVRKKLFKPTAGKGWESSAASATARASLIAAGLSASLLGTGSPEEELALAVASLRLVELEDVARKVAKAGGAEWRSELTTLADRLEAAWNEPGNTIVGESARDVLALPRNEAAPHERAGAIAAHALAALEAWLAHRRHDHADGAHRWPSLREPKKLDFQKLVQIRRPDEKLPELFVGPADHRREREGFVLTDRRHSSREMQAEVEYCLYCHDRDKDSCSKGLRDPKTSAIKPNALGVPLDGCPLEEKISEAHLVRREGDFLAALALVTVDNPMCPGTGHRICNDCMKACIFQKQEPVNIPAVETATLTDVLSLPWGFEIYGLLTRWNPLNVKMPHPLPDNGKNVLVVGLGPAGYTLVHHLTRAGFSVAGIDGLKIEPLPVALTGDDTHAPRPIRHYAKLEVELDERILLGFGGVSEYGITARWDKNFLTAMYVTIARSRRARLYGGIRFGGTLTLEDAWKLGFDHVALAAGAGKPTIIDIKNNLARGIRKASDFLMALQLMGAYKRSSLANLQVQLPAVVIGGGLTAIDTATELLAYYVVQCEKTAARYRTLIEERNESEVLGLFDGSELAFLQEQCAHADAIAEERRRAEEENRAPRIQQLLDSWGGVSLVYRKTVLDSPAYRLNHEEVEKSLEEGVRYIENLSPTEAVLDDNGSVMAMKFERQALVDGKWRASGETVELPARTVCVAAGTAPNTTYEKEYPGVFALDARKSFFVAHEATRDEGGGIQLSPAKAASQAFFTSYLDGQHTVSFYGDNHPHYAGSVVKAMASAKVGFEKVLALYGDADPNVRLTPAVQSERQAATRALFDKLDDEFLAVVHDVIRLTPTIVEIVVRAPAAARRFEPGQFYRLQNYEASSPVVEGVRLNMEGLALTGAWVDKANGLLSTIVLEMGVSSRLCAMLKKGDPVVLMGPTGTPTEVVDDETVLLVGGGLGNAVLFSIAKAAKERKNKVLYFAGYRKGEDVFRMEDIEAATDQVIWCTDSGEAITPRRPQDGAFRGNIVQAMIAFAEGKIVPPSAPLHTVKRIIAIGSDRMMAAVKEARHTTLAPYLDKRHIGLGSINSPMQCMMKEICAQCLQKHKDPETGREFMVFSCTNQDQELDKVDFVHLNQRLRANSAQEKVTNLFLSGLLDRHPELRGI